MRKIAKIKKIGLKIGQNRKIAKIEEMRKIAKCSNWIENGTKSKNVEN